MYETSSKPRLRPSLNGALTLPPPEALFGRTERMQKVREAICSVAPTDIPVLIQGASGTGKDLFARLLHQTSLRAHHPMIRVSCPAIPTSLLESELFGYEKGAFTGANQTKKGRVEQAHRGTLLLDEVNSLDPLMQAKLLQVVQDGVFTRVGGQEERAVATRLISIASEDIQAEVAGGTFRLDLLHRINAVSIKLPSLRERIEDLRPLVNYFMRIHAMTLDMPVRDLSNSTLQIMERYHWPGNIRQLENMVRAFLVMGDEDRVAAELIPAAPTVNEIVTEIDCGQQLSLKEITRRAKKDIERQIILKVLRGNGWNRRKTAEQLQISYRSLLYKLDEGKSSPGSSASPVTPKATLKETSIPGRLGPSSMSITPSSEAHRRIA